MQTVQNNDKARPKSAYQVLTEAQNLIRDPNRWTQGTYARDANGKPTGVMNPRAVCWCFSAALLKAGGGEPYGSGLRPDLQELLRGEPSGCVHTNDDIGHGAVMALADRLREKAKALEVVS